jgi:hypothetical protein
MLLPLINSVNLYFLSAILLAVKLAIIPFSNSTVAVARSKVSEISF